MCSGLVYCIDHDRAAGRWTCPPIAKGPASQPTFQQRVTRAAVSAYLLRQLHPDSSASTPAVPPDIPSRQQRSPAQHCARESRMPAGSAVAAGRAYAVSVSRTGLSRSPWKVRGLLRWTCCRLTPGLSACDSLCSRGRGRDPGRGLGHDLDLLLSRGRSPCWRGDSIGHMGRGSR